MMLTYLDKTYLLPNEPLLTYPILKYMENVAREHMGPLNLNRDAVIKCYSAVWMVARTSLNFSSPALPGCPLTIRTWLRPMKRGMIIRDFEFYQNGALIGEAMQIWVLVDYIHRRMIRMDDLEALQNYPHPAVLKTQCPARIKTPEMLSDAPSLCPSPDAVDENGHINNASYVPLALSGLISDQIRSLQLNYHQECFAEQTLPRKYWRDDKQLFVQLYTPQGDAAFTLLSEFF